MSEFTVISDVEIDKQTSALYAISPSLPREDWVKIAWAANSAGVSEEAFIEWSKQADNFSSEEECKAKFREGSEDRGVTAGTLYFYAMKAGWKPEKSDVKIIRNDPESVWNDAIQATSQNEYIQKKLGSPAGLKIYNGELKIKNVSMKNALMIPCYTGLKITNVQFILSDGKYNLPGGKLLDGYFTVGKINHNIYLCEGIGQAWAVNALTDDAAIVCFSAGRIKKIAETVKRKYPQANIIIVADRGKENEAAQISGTTYVVMPEEKTANYDINDLLIEDE